MVVLNLIGAIFLIISSYVLTGMAIIIDDKITSIYYISLAIYFYLVGTNSGNKLIKSVKNSLTKKE